MRAARCEFVTVFGVDGFAVGEVEGEVGVAALRGCGRSGAEGFEVHLDAGFGGVPAGAVGESF